MKQGSQCDKIKYQTIKNIRNQIPRREKQLQKICNHSNKSDVNPPKVHNNANNETNNLANLPNYELQINLRAILELL